MANTLRSVAYDATEDHKTPEDIAAYLDAAMEDENEQVLLMSLRNAATAIVGISELARRTGLFRKTLYRTLSSQGNPIFSTLRAILRAFGLTLPVHAP